MKKILITIAVGFIMQHYGYSQSSLDPTWANRFQTVLDSVILANNVKGGSVAVLFPGQGLWTGVTGIASPGVPLTPDRRLCIASNTKLFIAVTLAKLQEQGILSLDDSLCKWLPAFQHVDSTITVRQLLSHQSGIFDYLNDKGGLWSALWTDTTQFWTPEEILATIGPPHFPKVQGWRYSNTNYLLAGMVIEAATDTTWVSTLHDIIFDPLDMDSTFVAVFEPQNGPIAPMYMYNKWHYNPETSFYSAFGPAGAIFSTAQETAQWYYALFNGEIISDSSLLEVLRIETSSLYGLGIGADNDSALSHPGYGHTGTVGNGYVSVINYDQKMQSVICLLTNGGLTSLQPIMEPLIKVLYNEYPKMQNDAGVTRIISPWDNICNAATAPVVLLKNFGSDPLTTVNIHYMIDEGSSSVFPWTGILSPDSTLTIVLPSITPGEGCHLLTCYTSGPNGGTEGYYFNDTAVSNFIVNGSAGVTAPWSEDFEDPEFPPLGWIEDPIATIQWGRTSLVSYTGQSTAVKCNYWDDNIGTKYNLDMPMIDIGNMSNPVLEFMYAYAIHTGYSVHDSLRIIISPDCGATWQTLFYKGGTSLATAPASSNAFFPKSNQWSRETISLEGYAGNILIRFQNICGYESNLFIDDVHIGWATSSRELLSDTSIICVYPNPFDAKTTFEYNLVIPVSVSLKIYNNLGQQIGVITNESQSAGKHQVKWDTDGLPAGVYYYRFLAGTEIGKGKMIKY